jgi:hypothetical protein
MIDWFLCRVFPLNHDTKMAVASVKLLKTTKPHLQEMCKNFKPPKVVIFIMAIFIFHQTLRMYAKCRLNVGRDLVFFQGSP